MEDKPKKIFTPSQAFKKAADFCVYQERCHQEVRDRLYLWGLHREDVENIIARLISDGYINEERFAKTFAGGKFRIKKWGRVKIKKELKLKKISDYCINKGLAEIDESEYIKTLNEIIYKKSKEIKEKNKFKKFSRLRSFALSKGYESELVWEVVKEKLGI
jgi:regulatory protein